MEKQKTKIKRVERSKREARESYNRLSRWYDLLAGASEKKYRNAGLEMLDVQEGEFALEIGFGTGHALKALAEAAGKTGKAYGVDISEGMAGITQKRIERDGLTQRVELILGDAAQLPLATCFFDAVFMSFTLELFDTPEIPTVLQECRRVMRSDGRIGVVSLAKSAQPNLAVRVYEWVHQKFPKYVDCRPIFVRQALESAEFEVTEAKQMSMWGLPVEIAVAKCKR